MTSRDSGVSPPPPYPGPPADPYAKDPYGPPIGFNVGVDPAYPPPTQLREGGREGGRGEDEGREGGGRDCQGKVGERGEGTIRQQNVEDRVNQSDFEDQRKKKNSSNSICHFCSECSDSRPAAMVVNFVITSIRGDSSHNCCSLCRLLHQ